MSVKSAQPASRRSQSFINLIVQNPPTPTENGRILGHAVAGSLKLRKVSTSSPCPKRKGIGILNGNTNQRFKVIEVKDNDGVTNYSRAIALRKSARPGRPSTRKVIEHHPSKKLKRKGKRHADKKENTNEDTEDESITCNHSFVSIAEEDTWDVLEKRKRSIRTKLSMKKEHLLTQDEEQDIHARAELYAITTHPDFQFFVLPEHDTVPRAPIQLEEVHIDTSYPITRKKRRRNYGNSCCYVNIHNTDDIYDNTKMLPIGTRLSKPSTKLVELVAMAIDGSPDGLLQVQQIYTFLQNKYPYFRYMERAAINSWRSSIRHALYQKWFRKIRFDLSFINSKGCYWAINHKTSPKEWTMPFTATNLDTEDDDLDLSEDLEEIGLDSTHDDVCALLKQEQEEERHDQRDLVAIVREYGVAMEDHRQYAEAEVEVVLEGHVPSPVREPDPILSTCAPDWQVCPASEDICLPSVVTKEKENFSPSDGASSNLISLAPCSNFLQNSDSTEELKTDLQLGTPISSPCRQQNGILGHPSTPVVVNSVASRVREATSYSPMLNWTPNWEEYGSYLLSPMSTQQSVYFMRSPETPGISREHVTFPGETGVGAWYNPRELYNRARGQSGTTGVLDSIGNSLNEATLGSETGSSDFEIVAEFPKLKDIDSPDSTSSLGFCS